MPVVGEDVKTAIVGLEVTVRVDQVVWVRDKHRSAEGQIEVFDAS